MRISDWSSACALPISVKRTTLDAAGLCAQGKSLLHRGPSMPIASHPHMSVRFGKAELALVAITMIWGTTFLLRSEEHTSELQSLMRISYAVFCLKKKKKRLLTNIHNDYSKAYIQKVIKKT